MVKGVRSYGVNVEEKKVKGSGLRGGLKVTGGATHLSE